MKKHVAIFPDGSVKMYVTTVVPAAKDDPGTCDLVTVGVTFESSVAVGSSQFAMATVCPGGTGIIILFGQFMISGGVLSDGPS